MEKELFLMAKIEDVGIRNLEFPHILVSFEEKRLTQLQVVFRVKNTVFRVPGHLRVLGTAPSRWAHGERCLRCPAPRLGRWDGPWLGGPVLPPWGAPGASAAGNSWAGGSAPWEGTVNVSLVLRTKIKCYICTTNHKSYL